jgi:hypothetical protein
MLNPTPLAAQSRKVGMDTELRIKSSLQSIYTELRGHYNTEKKKIPNAIYMTISEKALSESWRAVITMLYKLRDAGVFGDDQAVGREEQTETKACEIYRNNCRKVVSVPKYGTDELDAKYLGLFEQHVDNLAEWNKDQEDLEIHQALLETYGETLRHGETQSVCLPNWNPNVFVAGMDAFGTLPAYSPNSATYTTNIRNAITALGGAGNVPGLTADVLSNISNYALRKRIERLDIPDVPGGKGYIVTISEIQAMYLGDPAWAARNLGNLYLARASLPEKVMNWPGVIGMYKDLLLVVDVRAATVDTAGAGLTAGYVYPGDNDQRIRTKSQALDVVTVHGKGAVWKWEPEKLHSISQRDDYDKIEGVGTACVRGIGIPIFRNDLRNPGTAGPGAPITPPAPGNPGMAGTAMEQFTSAIVLCGMLGGTPPSP